MTTQPEAVDAAPAQVIPGTTQPAAIKTPELSPASLGTKG